METFKHLSVSDALTLMERPDTIVVDVRDAESFKVGRMSGARHLDNETMPVFLQETEYEQPVIVCCYHGNMSQAAAQYLIQQGFDEVYSLDGGFSDWSANYPDKVDSSV